MLLITLTLYPFTPCFPINHSIPLLRLYQNLVISIRPPLFATAESSKQVREHFLVFSAFSCFFNCIARLQKEFSDGRMELGWDGAYGLLLSEIRSIRRKRSWPLPYVSYWRPVVEWIACASLSAGEEFALSVLKCGDVGGCVWTT